jgi:hypothetical protein
MSNGDAPAATSIELDQLGLARLMARGCARACFGDEIVLVTPELAAQIKAVKERQL